MHYVAIGDSFTEGVGDERTDGSPRGWADRVASGMARTMAEPVHYANLAIRGRLLEPIVTEQLDAALSLTPRPTLISLNGGGNDMMRPGADLTRLIGLTAGAVRRCADAGVGLLLLSGADPSQRLPFGRVIHRRGEQLTASIGDLITGYDITFVDAFNDAELRRPRYWSPDRLHLGPAGHARVAGLVLASLGLVEAGRPEHEEEIAAGPAPRGLAGEARYYREHVLPWVQRRLRGRSSGDGRPPKHPEWTEVSPG